VAYCVANAVVYFVCAVLGVLFLLMPEELSDSGSPVESYIMGALLVLVGILFAAFYLAAFLLPRSKAAWIVGIVAIALGLSSPCCLPAAIPLLIVWIRDDTRTWFHAR
jgi:drug/metabolite transporter (DMT)-like permease